jgi:hypothetical protein
MTNGTSWTALGAVCLAMGLIGACSGGGKAKTEDDFCLEKTTAECQSVSNKCATLVDPCVTGRLSVCHEFVSEAKASGTRFFVPGNISNCVNKSKSTYAKNGAITPTDLDALDDVCNYVFQGNAMDRQACTVKYDCLDKSEICDKGRCAKRVEKSKGDLCGNPGEVCKTGSFCQLMDGNVWECAERAAENKVCSDDVPCKEELRCSLGSCTKRAGNLASCGSDEDCEAAVPYCDPYAGSKCTSGLLFGPGSTSCTAFANPTTGAGGSGGGRGGSGGATGTAGHGGSGGATGTAGRGGSGGATGAAGHGGSAGGSGGSTGVAGSSGGAGGAGAAGSSGASGGGTAGSGVAGAGGSDADGGTDA